MHNKKILNSNCLTKGTRAAEAKRSYHNFRTNICHSLNLFISGTDNTQSGTGRCTFRKESNMEENWEPLSLWSIVFWMTVTHIFTESGFNWLEIMPTKLFENTNQVKWFLFYPRYGRHWISRPMQIVPQLPLREKKLNGRSKFFWGGPKKFFLLRVHIFVSSSFWRSNKKNMGGG